MNNTWCTIESDPAVFTELIEGLGVKDVEVNEIFTLDDEDYLSSLGDIYGFIFLFKWTKETNAKRDSNYCDPSLFFAEQVISDACATQALLSILLNHRQINIGENLTTFKEFCIHLDPYSRGLAIGESDHIRITHNSFSKPEPFSFQNVKSDKADDAFHFISYINYENSLLELDGLQKGPICHKSDLKRNWIESVKEVIQKRILLYSEKEIRFNLLAVVGSRKKVLLENLKKKEAELFSLATKLKAQGHSELDNFEFTNDFDRNLASIEDENFDLNLALNESKFLINQINALKMDLKEYQIKRNLQNKENQRRKNNYLPLIFELFKKSAEKGNLLDMYNKAKN